LRKLRIVRGRYYHMKGTIAIIIMAGTFGLARAGDIERLKGDSGLQTPELRAAQAVQAPVPVSADGDWQSVYSSWNDLVQDALTNGVAMNMPVPGYGTRVSRILTKGFNDETKPLDLFAVYGKAGSGALEPENLYFQRIYTLPGKILSYIFISTLEGKLLAAYTAVSSQEGSGTFPNSIQDPEVINRFMGFKSFWIYSPVEKPAAPAEIAERVDFLRK
jgi:hypothetical protein